MNSQRVSNLVKLYKGVNLDSKKSKRSKNIIIKTLLQEYDLIFKSIINHYKNKKDAESICVTQLILAINDFDTTKKIQFNTFFWYYLKAVGRIYYKENINYNDIEEQSIPDVFNLLDLSLDISKILTKEELLIYQAYLSGKISSRSKKLKKEINTISDKLYNYIGNS